MVHPPQLPPHWWIQLLDAHCKPHCQWVLLTSQDVLPNPCISLHPRCVCLITPRWSILRGNFRSDDLHDKLFTYIQHSLMEHNILWELLCSLNVCLTSTPIPVSVHEQLTHVPALWNGTHHAVYDLKESLTHNKLQMFCKIMWDAGLCWAWSNTCCINKTDHFVL